MKNLIVLVSLVFSLSTLAMPNRECPNKELTDMGFKIHKTDKFESLKKKIVAWSEGDNFEFDMDGTFYNLDLNKWFTVVSLDNVDTDRYEMFGDVAIFRDHFTKEITEVRWYENGLRNLVYSTAQRCAQTLVPIPDNALF